MNILKLSAIFDSMKAGAIRGQIRYENCPARAVVFVQFVSATDVIPVDEPMYTFAVCVPPATEVITGPTADESPVQYVDPTPARPIPDLGTKGRPVSFREPVLVPLDESATE
jgi:hypothetical protein